jgi:anti-sigma regulatory factor (Ser/Thr protein kinase)
MPGDREPLALLTNREPKQAIDRTMERPWDCAHTGRGAMEGAVSVMAGSPMALPQGSRWPLFSVLPPMDALPTAPRTARMHLRDTLKGWGLPELIDDGELVASELVTNVVLMAHDPVTGRPAYVDHRLPVLQFGLFSDRAQLLVSVWDQFPDPPLPRTATADDESGRGLMITGSISASLDWYRTEGGKVVRALLRAAA